MLKKKPPEKMLKDFFPSENKIIVHSQTFDSKKSVNVIRLFKCVIVISYT